jgi:hypothetical protein
MKIQQLKESDLLYQDIEKRIDSIKQKKNLYLSLFRTTKIIVFIAGATITILTGWEITSETKSKFNPDNYILVISACITLLAAIEGLFNFRDKGKICFDYIVSAYSYEKNKKIHFDKFQSILESQKSIIENSEGEDE